MKKKCSTTHVSNTEHKHETVTIIFHQKIFWFWKAETFVWSKLWNLCKLAQMCMFLQMKCSKNYMYLSTKISNEKEYQTLSWFVSFNCWELVSYFQGYYLFLQQKLQACCHLLLLELRQTRSVLASCSSPPLHRSFPGHRPFAQIYSNYKPCPFACNHGVAIFKG